MQAKEFNLRREREIVGTMLSLMRRGIYPWRSPYPPGSIKKVAYNFSTEEEYHGTNQVVLLADCWKSSYASPAFLGEKQAEKMGGVLKSGVRPVWVVSARVAEIPQENGEAPTPVIKYFWNRVFNHEQFDGLPELRSNHNAYALDLDGGDNVWEAISFAESYLRSQNIRIIESESESLPQFNAARRTMTVPGKGMFARIGENSSQLEAYAVKLIQDSISSTAVPLERFAEQKKKSGKDDLDALEALVCEIGSSVLFNKFNLKAPETDGNMDTWIRQISNNHKSMFRAFRDADRAVKYIEHAVAGPVPHVTHSMEAGR